jgi:hypothetical protein
MTTRSLSLLVILGSMTAGCPGKESGDPETGTSSEATTTTGSTTSEPTTSGSTETSGASTSGTTSDTVEPTTTDASSSTGPEMPPPSPTCKCIDPDVYGVSSYTCSHEGGCDDVVAFCDVEAGMDTPGCSYGTFSIDEVALDCAIDHLIAGQPGLVWWQIDSNGPEQYGAWVDIGKARQGTGRSWDFIDLGGTDYDAGTFVLKDAAYFEDCKTRPDVEEKFLCFKDWGVTPPNASCDAEESYSDPF